MPGPIGHIVYAEKIAPLVGRDLNSAEFRIGTSFPDIRGLDAISRDKTYFQNVTFQDLVNAGDSFMRGMLAHSMIDQIREEFLAFKDVYKDLPNSYLSTVALKICEDEQLYNRFDDWDGLESQLDTVLPQEMAFGIEEEKVKEWHNLLKEFFAQPPHKGVQKILRGHSLSNDDVAKILQLAAEIEKAKLVDTYLDEFYEHLESLAAAIH